MSSGQAVSDNDHARNHDPSFVLKNHIARTNEAAGVQSMCMPVVFRCCTHSHLEICNIQTIDGDDFRHQPPKSGLGTRPWATFGMRRRIRSPGRSVSVDEWNFGLGGRYLEIANNARRTRMDRICSNKFVQQSLFERAYGLLLVLFGTRGQWSQQKAQCAQGTVIFHKLGFRVGDSRQSAVLVRASKTVLARSP